MDNQTIALVVGILAVLAMATAVGQFLKRAREAVQRLKEL